MARTKVPDFLYEKESYEIRGACFDVYKAFGGAFKEKVIDNALTKALHKRGLKVESQKRIDIYIDQFWKYLKGSEYKLGFLVNFAPAQLEIKRIVYEKARHLKEFQR